MKKTLEEELRKAADFTNQEPLLSEKELMDLVRFSDSQSTRTNTTLFWRFVMIMNIILSGLTIATLIPLEYDNNPLQALPHPKKSTTSIIADGDYLRSTENPEPFVLPVKIDGQKMYNAQQKDSEKLGLIFFDGSTEFTVSILLEKNNPSTLLDILKKREGTSSATAIQPDKLVSLLYAYGYDTTGTSIPVRLKIIAEEFAIKAEILQQDKTAIEANKDIPQPQMITHDVRYHGKNYASVVLCNTTNEDIHHRTKAVLEKLFTGKMNAEENSMLLSFVPIKIPIKGTKTSLVLWYYPTNNVQDIVPDTMIQKPGEDNPKEKQSIEQSNEQQYSHEFDIAIQYLAPNPAQNMTQVVLKSRKDQEIIIGVYSLDGQLLMNIPAMMVQAESTVKIPLEFQLPNGIYHVIAANQQGMQSVTRLIITK